MTLPEIPIAPRPSRYEVLVKIGAGGTASVYLARITGPASFSRLVAVKRPHPHILRDPVAYQSFVAEAALASKIHHANVIAVHDVEADEDDLRLVMDYVEGVSLAELLELAASGGPPLPVPVALRIALDAAAGLAAVHGLEDDRGRRLGVLHRDVSPQNILVGLDGTARLADLGLARQSSSRRSEATGGVVGKLAYLAPERLEGSGASVQSDLFALGVVVWEALSGRRLFRGSSEAETLEKLRSFEPARLSRLDVDQGPELDEVIRKAIHKDPARRWASARDFAAALGDAARAHDLVASSAEVGDHVRVAAAGTLQQRRDLLQALGGDATSGLRSTQTAPLVQPPVSAPRSPSAMPNVNNVDYVDEKAIAPARASVPKERWWLGLSARSQLAGLAGSVALAALMAWMWSVGASGEGAAPPARALAASLPAAVAGPPLPAEIAASTPPAPMPRAPSSRRVEEPGRPHAALAPAASRAEPSAAPSVSATPSVEADLGF